MSEIYFTIAGTNHHHGQEFIEPDMPVKLIKEPDNEVDSEAIKVEMRGIGQIGYVANSPYTVLGESMSAGRLYDKIGDEAAGKVLYVLAKALHTTPNYLLMGESDEGSWAEDMLNILEKISDQAMRTLAMKQFKCIAEL